MPKHRSTLGTLKGLWKALFPLNCKKRGTKQKLYKTLPNHQWLTMTRNTRELKTPSLWMEIHVTHIHSKSLQYSSLTANTLNCTYCLFLTTVWLPALNITCSSHQVHFNVKSSSKPKQSLFGLFLETVKTAITAHIQIFLHWYTCG